MLHHRSNRLLLLVIQLHCKVHTRTGEARVKLGNCVGLLPEKDRDGTNSPEHQKRGAQLKKLNKKLNGGGSGGGKSIFGGDAAVDLLVHRLFFHYIPYCPQM